MTVITEPGVYTMDEADYHADPVPGGSLSCSGAKKLLACPARFAYDREHPPAPTPAMELGTAAHKLKVVRQNGDFSYVYLDPDYLNEARGAFLWGQEGRAW